MKNKDLKKSIAIKIMAAFLAGLMLAGSVFAVLSYIV